MVCMPSGVKVLLGFGLVDPWPLGFKGWLTGISELPVKCLRAAVCQDAEHCSHTGHRAQLCKAANKLFCSFDTPASRASMTTPMHVHVRVYRHMSRILLMCCICSSEQASERDGERGKMGSD